MVGYGHLKNVYIYIYIFHYLILSYFLHFTIGSISVAHLRTTPWATPVDLNIFLLMNCVLHFFVTIKYNIGFRNKRNAYINPFPKIKHMKNCK